MGLSLPGQTFRQSNAFATFSRNVRAAHNANNVSLLSFSFESIANLRELDREVAEPSFDILERELCHDAGNVDSNTVISNPANGLG